MKGTIKTRLLFFSFVILVSFFQISCKKDTSPTAPDETIPQNLFPLAVGRQWIYDYKETDLNGNVITGRSGTHEMKVTGTMSIANKLGLIVHEITRIGTNIDTNTVFFHIDNNGNIWQYLLFGDPGTTTFPGWVIMFNRTLGIEKTHTIIDTTVNIDGTLVRFQFSSILKRKVSITVPLGQYNEAYPGELEWKFSIIGSELKYKFRNWFVPGIGPVKFVEDLTQDFGQPVIGYKVKELRSKNF